MIDVKKINVMFEIKSMGISFYLPIAVLLYLLVLNYTGSGPDFIRRLSLFIEFIVCPLAAWWSIYLLLDYYEEGLEKLLFSYPVSVLFHGLIRVLLFLFIYLIGVLLVLFAISLTHNTMGLKSQLLQYYPQCLLYAAVGFFLMVATRNIIVPLLSITGYVAVKFFTSGSQLFPIYNIMAFDFVHSPQYLLEKALQNLLLAILFFLLGHVFLVKRSKALY
ncbi:hypothetical protein [Aquibacillus rhizosphaerae]|uniref:ABC transporter permease n=1 Tax=Aquibacillus rhizosphaerae TaxID=3051431 RepID=A0ABT7L0X7_9BACI|nr:hypothetical protein [Aquibacillus sp. LR5S19]MDL4839493.1 hypothetical protein [Aquibacillus sp. LR5S19]